MWKRLATVDLWEFECGFKSRKIWLELIAVYMHVWTRYNWVSLHTSWVCLRAGANERSWARRSSCELNRRKCRNDAAFVVVAVLLVRLNLSHAANKIAECETQYYCTADSTDDRCIEQNWNHSAQWRDARFISLCQIKAKFHKAIWSQTSSKQVRSWLQTCSELKFGLSSSLLAAN